jgi:hypothetical protein
MPLFSVAPVKISGVTKLQRLHNFGQWYDLHLHQQMDMVPHQRIGIQMKPIQEFLFRKKRKIGLKVFIVQGGILPLVPPRVMSIKKCHFERREKSKISQS